jgi:fatty acid desaturase
MTSLERSQVRPTKRRPPGARQAGSDFTALSQQMQSSGLLRRRYGYYWTKLLALPVLFGIAVVAFVLIGDTWWQLFLAAGFAVLFTQTAFLGHDAAHRQIFRSGKWNEWTSLVIANLFLGMSYGWWQHKHTRHHARPNQKGVDPDIDLPVIAFTPEQARKPRGPVASWLISHQGWFFFPILFLEGLSLHASSVRRVFSPAPMQRRWVEVVFISVRLGGYLTLIFLVLSPGIGFAFLGVQLGLFGFYMGMAFAPNHKGMPLVPKGAEIDFLRRQVLMSRNIRSSRFIDVLMGGLNYQVEHHLFPSMPRPHLRLAAPMVAAYCGSLNIAYTQTGLFESYRIVVKHINRVGLGESDPFDCPLAVQRQTV